MSIIRFDRNTVLFFSSYHNSQSVMCTFNSLHDTISRMRFTFLKNKFINLSSDFRAHTNWGFHGLGLQADLVDACCVQGRLQVYPTIKCPILFLKGQLPCWYLTIYPITKIYDAYAIIKHIAVNLNVVLLNTMSYKKFSTTTFILGFSHWYTFTYELTKSCLLTLMEKKNLCEHYECHCTAHSKWHIDTIAWAPLQHFNINPVSYSPYHEFGNLTLLH